MQREKEEENVMDSLVCPSFSAYSSNTLNDIVDQVTQNDVRLGQNDTDFEFVAICKAVDGIFVDDAAPAFPIFDGDLATAEEDGAAVPRVEDDDLEAIQITLGKLLMDDSSSQSCSSSVEDELENVPPGTYCMWKPRTSPATPSPCRKSKSTGSSSKRWKLLDLLRRSNSEGKESVVFLASSSTVNSTKKKVTKSETGKKNPANGGGKEKRIPAVSAHEALYIRNREMRREYSRKSYLPYRQDLVGFCVNLNSMGKAFPPHF